MGKEIADNIDTINAYTPNCENPKAEIENYISAHSEDSVLVLTDVMFGSVNQFAIGCQSSGDMYIITGINLPLVMEVVSKVMFNQEHNEITRDFIDETVKKAKEELLYVDDRMSSNSNDDDFFA